MKQSSQIVPGEAIGPFMLGMTRAEIGRLPVRPNVPQQGFPRPGVYVYYDQDDKCNKIQAIFSYKPTPPIFTLFGHVVNGMTEKEFRALVGGRPTYGGTTAGSLGISAAKWEHGDNHIMSITVIPAERAHRAQA